MYSNFINTIFSVRETNIENIFVEPKRPKPIIKFSHYDTTARRNDKLPYYKMDWVRYNILRHKEGLKCHEYYQQRKQ